MQPESNESLMHTLVYTTYMWPRSSAWSYLRTCVACCMAMHMQSTAQERLQIFLAREFLYRYSTRTLFWQPRLIQGR